MLNTKKTYLVATTLFVVAQIILSVFIQKTGDVTYGVLTVSSVALCFLFVLIGHDKSFVSKVTVFAFAFTLVADFFLSKLVDFEGTQLIAMCVFCLVQGCYFIRVFHYQSRLQRLTHLIVKVLATIVSLVLTIVVLGDKTNALALIAVFYFSQLIVNIVYAFIQIKLSILLPIGLLLFMLCDIFVGLFVLGTIMPIPDGSIIHQINNIGVNLAWVFYVPSQTLLALSVKGKLILSRK